MQAVWRLVGKLKRICQGFLWICDDFFMLRFSSPSCEILYLLKKGGVRETGGGGTNVAWRACPSLPKLSKKEIWFEGHAKIPTSASELIIAHRALEMIIHHVIRYVLLMSFPGLVGEKTEENRRFSEERFNIRCRTLGCDVGSSIDFQCTDGRQCNK